MTDITNEQRAGWAAHAVLQYATGKEGGEELYDDPETVLTDLLTDLRHYTVRENIAFKTCLDRAEMHYDAEATEELDNTFGLRCPQCGASDQIDICADVWVRLCPDGADATAAENGDTEWTDHSGAKCCACGFGGNVSDFSTRPDTDQFFAAIAEEHLSIDTLETRRRDLLDFHNVSVQGVRAALGAAYEAGKKAGPS
ncbi:MAG: hypothetical protein ABR866_05180 [Candidatus Korobacteraceae bacterium]|jgi:hypothetical protein